MSWPYPSEAEVKGKYGEAATYWYQGYWVGKKWGIRFGILFGMMIAMAFYPVFLWLMLGR